MPSGLNREGLLLLARDNGELRGVIVPFSEAQIPYDTLTVFNFTRYPVAAEIDGSRRSIPARNFVNLPYLHVAIEKEALQTRFAVETEEGWSLVQNGFVPTVPNGRVLFFISDDLPASPSARRLRPVRFTYVYELQASEETRRARDQIPQPPHLTHREHHPDRRGRGRRGRGQDRARQLRIERGHSASTRTLS